MIRAIIIEDEIPARQTLKSYLKKYFPQIVVVSEIDSVSEAIELLSKRKYDIVFLDVQLKDGTALQVLEKIEVHKMRVIFTTAHDEFTQEAFRYKAFGYLLKPLDPDDFKDIVNRVIKDVVYSDPKSSFIKIRHKTGYISISINEIVRCAAESNYTKFVTIDGGQFVLAKTLKSVEESLLPKQQFIRPHQSHMVNLNFIDKNIVNSKFITTLTGEQIPISRSRKDSIKEPLLQIGIDLS